MLRSISFVIEGWVTTQVRVTGNLDGTLSFELTRGGTGGIEDLQAVFFDLNRHLDGDGFEVFGDAGLTLGACVEAGVDTLGREARVRRPMVDALGDFDIGITFGRYDGGRGTPRTAGFTLSHATAPLTLDMIDMVDFGLRYAWRGADSAEVTGAQTSVAGAHDPATPAPGALDVLEVVEVQAVHARPLADDTRGGVLAVIDFQGAWEAGMALAGRSARARARRAGVRGRHLPDGAADGTDPGETGLASRLCPWPSNSWDGLLGPV